MTEQSWLGYCTAQEAGFIDLGVLDQTEMAGTDVAPGSAFFPTRTTKIQNWKGHIVTISCPILRF